MAVRGPFKTEDVTMAGLNLAQEPDDTLILRAAWLYYMAGLNQQDVADRLGVHRTRVVRLLAEARDRGLVSMAIHHESIRETELEQTFISRYNLDFCLVTPCIGIDNPVAAQEILDAQAVMARRAVGTAAATFLKGHLAVGEPITIGVSWGRTIEQMALQLAGVRNRNARFVSLLGSLTRNSASNPFEVVQALAARTGGEGYFLPVPFIVNTLSDRQVLMAQRIVTEVMDLARAAAIYFISVGELTEHSILRQQNMLTKDELRSMRARGVVADTIGRLFDEAGNLVEHPMCERMLAFSVDDLRGRDVVLLGAGLEKANAIRALLRSKLIRGLIIDGDTASCVLGMP
jgi:DNA-binding transcriptional regulator LsrR (DeoR family)